MLYFLKADIFIGFGFNTFFLNSLFLFFLDTSKADVNQGLMGFLFLFGFDSINGKLSS